MAKLNDIRESKVDNTSFSPGIESNRLAQDPATFEKLFTLAPSNHKQTMKQIVISAYGSAITSKPSIRKKTYQNWSLIKKQKKLLTQNQLESEFMGKLTPLEHLVFSQAIKASDLGSASIVETTNRSKQLISRVIRRLVRGGMINYAYTPLFANLGLTLKIIEIQLRKTTSDILLPEPDWIYATWRITDPKPGLYLLIAIPESKESSQVLMRYLNRVSLNSEVIDVLDYDIGNNDILWERYENPHAINRKTLRWITEPADVGVVQDVPIRTALDKPFGKEELEIAQMLQLHGNIPLRRIEQLAKQTYRRAKELKEYVEAHLLHGWVTIGPAFNYEGFHFLFEYSKRNYRAVRELAKSLPKANVARIRGYDDLLLLFARVKGEDLELLRSEIEREGLEPSGYFNSRSVLPGYLSYAYPIHRFDLDKREWNFDFDSFLGIEKEEQKAMV